MDFSNQEDNEFIVCIHKYNQMYIGEKVYTILRISQDLIETQVYLENFLPSQPLKFFYGYLSLCDLYRLSLMRYTVNTLL